MTDGVDANQSPTTFTWHPAYAGKSIESVRRDVRDEIARDQRQYQLSLDGAETSEHDSLTSIVELERRWGPYDFNWAEMDPQVLADKIVAFELERDQRREMITYGAWREEQADTGEEIAPEMAWKTAPVLIGVVILIVIIVVMLASVL